jgi:hypothetical protein
VFSCLFRIGCLVILLIGGVFAWMARERWMPRVLGESAAPAIAWEPIDEPGARRAADAVAALESPRGPAFMELTAAELGSLLLAASGHRLPSSIDSVQAAIEGERVLVRGLVKLDDIRGLDALGPLSGLLDTRERIELTGTLGVVRPGLGEFRIASVQIADLQLPAPAIPRLLARLDSSARPEGVSPDGIAISIPEYIGDVRVSRDKVTLYRRTP